MYNFACLVTLFTFLLIPFVFTFFSAENSANPNVTLLEVKFFTNDKVEHNISENCAKLPTTFKEITFSCVATYPTEWKFTNAPHKDPYIKDIKISKLRTFSDFDDNATFIFQSNLTLRFKDPSVLQNLTCRGAKRKRLEMKNTSVIVKDGYACHIHFCMKSQVDTEVIHKNRNREGFNIGCGIQLEVDVKNKRFNCKYNNDSHSPPEGVPEPLTRLITCHTQDECSAIFKSDYSSCNDSVIWDCSHTNCKSLNPSMEPGVIVCSDGLTSVARRYFVTNSFGIEENLTLHFEKSWEDADVADEESIAIGELKGKVYCNESFSMECHATSWRFSHGFVWSITSLENGNNILYMRDGEEVVDESEFTFNNTMKFLIPEPGEYEISCIGPKWNSFDWVYSTINITVHDPVLPSNVSINMIEENHDGNITTILECKAKYGDPPPKYEWDFKTPTGLLTRLDQQNPYYSLNVTDNSRIALKASDLKKKEYICKASNNFGQANISYVIKNNRKRTIYIVVTTLALIATVTGFSCCCIIIRKQRKRLKELSDDEIREFQHGNPESNNAMLLPYNVAYEISSDIIFIEGIVLGEGQFAQVLSGKVGSVNVAIKTLKPSADVLYFKALLSELKILCYVGEHPNIVNLVGANTKNIRKKEVFIIMEYCANGSMLTMLRKSREKFINRLRNDDDDYKISRQSVINYENASVKHLTTQDLAKWACDIASGMEFLRLKNVIHGDLAARNILISANMKAKVGDFGLAKQLFEYSIYIQKLNCPLPLKWMALESLQDLEFSLDSDIWSYGITIWEIFSLGQTPYPGIPQWDFESYKLLIGGYRMEKPDFANTSIYELMLRCWDSDPKQRPSFEYLRYCIEEELSRMKL